MILKPVDPKSQRAIANKRAVAGYGAERQMAHYLDRAFGDDKSIHVLNDLRLGHASGSAQIDHLVVGEYGFVIVESKSVSEEIFINDLGEWSRTVEGRLQGMPCPLRQAERQMKIVLKLLNEAIPIRKKFGLTRSMSESNGAAR